MDPINNNQTNNQQANMEQQTASVQQNPAGTPPPSVQYQNPTGKSHKTMFLLLILLIAVVGLAGFLVFANINTAPPVPPAPIPSVKVAPPTSTPTPAEDDLNVEDPQIDLKVLDDSAATL